MNKKKWRGNSWQLSWDEYREELYFCRQYYKKKEMADSLITLRVSTLNPVMCADGTGVVPNRGGGGISDPVPMMAAKREKYLRDIELIEECARQAGGDLYPWLLRSVTGRENVRSVLVDCPCSERAFYNKRRLFFFMLHEARQL